MYIFEKYDNFKNNLVTLYIAYRVNVSKLSFTFQQIYLIIYRNK